MMEELLSTDYLLKDRAAWKKQAELANARADRLQEQLVSAEAILEDVPGQTLLDRLHRLKDWYQELYAAHHKLLANTDD